MRTKGALLWGPHQPWSIEEIDVGEPVAGEVLVRLAACGLCHTEEHLVHGDLPGDAYFPILGGHEASGTVLRVGDGVEHLLPGDPVVLSAAPSCGRCHFCQTGQPTICDEAERVISGRALADDTRRVTVGDVDVAQFCLTGGFAPYATVHERSVVKIEKDIPLDLASLLGCGVTTGWFGATRVAGVRPGENVVVMGMGGVGASAVMGAAAAGAERVVVIDPAGHKAAWAHELGATHFYVSLDEAVAAVTEMTWARMAEKVLITVDRIFNQSVVDALSLCAKSGTIVPISTGGFDGGGGPLLNIPLMLTAYQRTVRGGLLGGGNPREDIKTLINLYAAGRLPLEKLVTARYCLEQINEGYQAMREARNIRGLITYGDDDY